MMGRGSVPFESAAVRARDREIETNRTPLEHMVGTDIPRAPSHRHMTPGWGGSIGIYVFVYAHVYAHVYV